MDDKKGILTIKTSATKPIGMVVNVGGLSIERNTLQGILTA